MIIQWTSGALNQDVQGGAYGTVWNWAGTPITPVLGPFCVHAHQVFDAGATEAEVFQAGAVVTQTGCE
jgi:hypothetical protein